MKQRFSDAVLAAVQKVVLATEVDGRILDAYGAAEKIREDFPGENIASSDLVALMLRTGLQAIEISPPALIIEFILPADDSAAVTSGCVDDFAKVYMTP